MVAFFQYGDGIFWIGNTAAPWRQLGINLLGAFVIFAWSLVWSLVIFGTLKLLNFLRIDSETEFRGCDLVKHGEHAYPVHAWAELQYDSQKNNNRMGPMMKGTDHDSKKSFNNALEMVPTVGGLFRSLSNNFDHFDGLSRDVEKASGNFAVATGIDNKAVDKD